MTPFERLIQSLASMTFSPWTFVKLLFLIGLLIYIAFAVIVVRQVALMSRTINGNFSLPIKLFSWVHLGAAVAIFVLALVIL